MKNKLFLGFFLFPFIMAAQDKIELNTILMNATYKIEGSGKIGTSFILGKPMKKDSTKAYYVLVTANHVLKDIKSDTATLFLRKEKNKRFLKYPISLKIRENGKPLWFKHPDVDVAVMYVRLPKDLSISLLPTFFLANDSIISEYEIHPGDELLCLGFPYGAESNDAGFPILRSGKISSYPILPSKEIKSFLYDFRIFGGNSGGPVYFIGSNRLIKGIVRIGEVRFLMGLVSEQLLLNEQIKSLTETTTKEHQLGLAKIIPAVYIKETIEMLPDLDR
jgi:S1-C subfamily serine protease